MTTTAVGESHLMKIQATCTQCGSSFLVKAEMAGRKGRCPKCREEIDITGTMPLDEGAAAPQEEIHRQEPPRNVPLALGAAIVAAALGAAAWGIIANTTGYEVGYIAWAVGAVVGFAGVKAGGRGADLGVACAGLALAAIVAGKLLAFSWYLDGELDQAADMYFTQAAYTEHQTDAGDFAMLPADADDAEIRDFMLEHEFCDAEAPEDIEDAQVAIFRKDIAPSLLRFHADQPGFEAWREEMTANFRAEVKSRTSYLSAVGDSLSLVDIIFALLGISTAYGIVASGGRKDREERPGRSRRTART